MASTKGFEASVRKLLKCNTKVDKGKDDLQVFAEDTHLFPSLCFLNFIDSMHCLSWSVGAFCNITARILSPESKIDERSPCVEFSCLGFFLILACRPLLLENVRQTKLQKTLWGDSRSSCPELHSARVLKWSVFVGKYLAKVPGRRTVHMVFTVVS